MVKIIYWYEHRFKRKKLNNNAVFGKTTENVRKHSYIKLAIVERRRNYFVSEPSYHTAMFFTENLLAIEMKKHSDVHE